MRLIDADALIKGFEDAGLGDYSLIESVFAAGVYAGIENAPTIDAVEVVRCRECIHRSCTKSTLGFSWCGKFGNIMRDADFCSWGERKMDGGASDV